MESEVCEKSFLSGRTISDSGLSPCLVSFSQLCCKMS